MWQDIRVRVPWSVDRAARCHCPRAARAARDRMLLGPKAGTKERITEVVYAVRLHKLVWVENKFGTVYPRWLI